jgi:hypothetical protein
MTNFTDVNISNQLKLHCEVTPKSKQQIVQAIWGYQNGIWQPLQPGGGLTYGDSFLTLKDTTEGNGEKEAQLFLITQQDGDKIEPLVGTNKGLVVQKDFAAGGFLSSNQGMLSLESGLNWQCDPPKIVLGHSGRPILYNIEEQSSEPPTHQQLQLYINTNDNHLYEYHEEGQEPHWHDKGHRSKYAGNFDTLYLKKFFSEDPAHLDLGNLSVHGAVTTEVLKHVDGKTWLDQNLNQADNAIFNSLKVISADGNPENGAHVKIGDQNIDYLGLTYDETCGYVAAHYRMLYLAGDNGIEFGSPIILGGSTGTAGQVLTSQGSGSAPVGGSIRIPTSAPSNPVNGDI